MNGEVWMFFFCLAGLILAFGLWTMMQKLMQSSQKNLEASLKSLAFDVFEKNNRFFMDLATSTFEKYKTDVQHDLDLKHLSFMETIKPIPQSLKQLDDLQRQLEQKREGAYLSLKTQIETLTHLERDLRKETITLSSALKSSQMRGSWGEMHLKRVLELAGLVSYCDFWTQKTLQEDGKTLRPDVIIQMPGDRYIAVDAKTPLGAYLDSLEKETDEEIRQKLLESAISLRKHMKDLSSKEYWKALDGSIDFVILFLPSEAFYSKILQVDPSIIDDSSAQQVVLATPSTLIAILKAVAFSWKQDAISKNAKDIAKLGSELYDRLNVVCQHWTKLGKNLNLSVESYNQAMNSLESRVLVTARRLKDLESLTTEITAPEKIQSSAKIIDSTTL